MNINIAVTKCFTAMSSTTNIIIACQDCAGKYLSICGRLLDSVRGTKPLLLSA
jgi:hypothetical protein